MCLRHYAGYLGCYACVYASPHVRKMNPQVMTYHMIHMLWHSRVIQTNLKDWFRSLPYRPKAYLTSDSFENGGNNLFSDSGFKESYELTLKSYDHSNPTVTIQCTALCISDKKLSMTMNVYKMSFDGSVLQDEFTFKSYPKDSPPSYEDYSYQTTL